MLTDIERERLIKRDSLAIKAKKANEYIIRNKLKTWLADIDDVNFILTKLPDKQLNKLVSNKIVFALMDLVATLLFILGVLPVIQNEYVPSGRQVRQATDDVMIRPSLRRGFYDVMRRATPEELERRDYLKHYITSLIDTLSDDDVEGIIDDIYAIRPNVVVFESKK